MESEKSDRSGEFAPELADSLFDIFSEQFRSRERSDPPSPLVATNGIVKADNDAVS
jgi:hypothetical protein